MNIEDLKINLTDKELLKYLTTPKTIAQVAFYLGVGYSYASTKLKVLLAGGLIKKSRFGKEVRYCLDQDEVEL